MIQLANNNNKKNNNNHHHLDYYDTLDNNKNFGCLIIYFVGKLLMCTLNYQNQLISFNFLHSFLTA